MDNEPFKDKRTPVQAWAEESAEVLTRPGSLEDLRLRVSIALIQARALECRQIGASLLVHCPSTIREVSNGLQERSHQLEKIGLNMAGVEEAVQSGKLIEMPSRESSPESSE